jgi:hypothetical protein
MTRDVWRPKKTNRVYRLPPSSTHYLPFAATPFGRRRAFPQSRPVQTGSPGMTVHAGHIITTWQALDGVMARRAGAFVDPTCLHSRVANLGDCQAGELISPAFASLMSVRETEFVTFESYSAGGTIRSRISLQSRRFHHKLTPPPVSSIASSSSSGPTASTSG